MKEEKLEELKSALLQEKVVEFTMSGEQYLIQIENNKGWDYLGLWRVSSRPVCLTRAFFDSMCGVDAECVEELLAQALPDGSTLPERLNEMEAMRIL